VSIIKPAHLFCLAVLLAGCSRAPERPPAPDAGQAAAQISERQGLDLLMAALKKHKVADLDCLGMMTESEPGAGGKAAQWEYAAREIHNERCGGDPQTSPVRDRYRVTATGKIFVYDAAEGEYHPL